MATARATIPKGETSTIFGWPAAIVHGAPEPSGELRFVASTTSHPRPTVRITRQVVVDGDVIRERDEWVEACPSMADAEARRDWLERHSARLAFACRFADAFGDSSISSELESAMARQARARRDEEEAEAGRRRLERKIDSFLCESRGMFGVNLQRVSDKQGFWCILFRERGERERFRDWWRWQRHRFDEFVAFLADHEPIDLERLLLKEMLETERRVKADGGGAGGRRPLRFWRGE